MKNVGRVEYDAAEKAWCITCEPHVAMKLKRVFAQLKKGQVGKQTLSDTPANARELEWFLDRYPMEVPDRERLTHRAREQRIAEDLSLSILSGRGMLRHFELALPPRDYQRQAAELALATGGLLLADDLGLGKTASAITMLSQAETRPALVVTMTHLTRQWQAELGRFAPSLRTHVLRSTTPYDLEKKCRHRVRPDPKAPGLGRCTTCGASRDDIHHGRVGAIDVVITNYHKLAGWGDALRGWAKTVIFDEAQELRSGLARETPAKYRAAKGIADGALFRCGLSVGPDSYLELRGGVFGAGWFGTIEEAYAMALGEARRSTPCGTYEIVKASNVEARGWTLAGFRWKAVRKFIRHGCDREVVDLFAGGVHTDMTTDHSVYVVRGDGLFEAPAGELSLDDVVAVDNGVGWSDGVKESPVDTMSLVSNIPQVQVVVDLTGIDRKDVGLTAWEWQNCHREAKYGSRLPLEVFLTHRAKLPYPTRVYVGRGRGSWLPPTLFLSRFAYVLGFYLGDGWTDGSRVCFAVESARVESFLAALGRLGIDLDPKILKMKGDSVEVRCSNKLFAVLCQRIFEQRRCFEKRIPGEWIVSWDEAARRELLRGLVDSDGHVAKRKKAMNFTTTSSALAHGVRALLRSLGVSSTLHRRHGLKPGGMVNGRQIEQRRPSYQVVWSWFALHGSTDARAGNRVRHHWAKGMMNQGRVRGTNVVEVRPSHVYDIEMGEHPSFVVNGVLVHNTATPIYNYGAEIYSVLNVLRPDCLGTFSEFATEWCEGGSLDVSKARLCDPKAFGTFARNSALMLRRTRADVGRELPDLTKVVQMVDSDTAALDQVSESCAELARIILAQGESHRGQKLMASEELSNKLRQATGIAKAPYVAAFVRMLVESGEKVVLWGWHREVYSIWLDKLKDLEPVMFTGSESAAQKVAARDAFVSGKTNLLIMSLRAGAGLDGLQDVCRVGVFGELDWSPGVHEQCGGRIHRDGQRDKTLLYFLVSDEGADPIMTDVLQLKRGQIEGLRDPNAIEVTSMTIDPNHVKMLAEDYLKRKAVA